MQIGWFIYVKSFSIHTRADVHAISILSTFDAQRRVDAVAYRFIIFFFERIDEQFYYLIVDAT